MSDTWPKHEDGSNKRVGDMTPNERKAVMAASNARVMSGNTLWAATHIDVRPTRCYPTAEAKVIIEGDEILYRTSWNDPGLFRDLAEADSFIATVSSSTSTTRTSSSAATRTSRKELTRKRKGVSAMATSHDIAVDALENLLHQLDLSPPDYETHPELCAAIAAAREDLLTIKTRVFAGMGKQLSETGKEVSEAAS